MSANKFFPKFVKAILPFAPVVGVVSTCLLVASAVAQVAEPILNAGISLQVNILCVIFAVHLHDKITHLSKNNTITHMRSSPSFSSISSEAWSATGSPN